MSNRGKWRKPIQRHGLRTHFKGTWTPERVADALEDGLDCPFCKTPGILPADDAVWRCDCGWSGAIVGEPAESMVTAWLAQRLHVESGCSYPERAPIFPSAFGPAAAFGPLA